MLYVRHDFDVHHVDILTVPAAPLHVGSMPGKLIQQLKLAECANPVIMLDEVDKLGRGGWRGDPAAALLEVLDPEQNGSYMDLFLDVPVDLSKVLFICTANTADTIPPALADRMDFINISGYIAAEKVQIASKYLQPLARKRSGVSESELLMNDDTLLHLIRWYAREAGVRKLSKLIDKVYSKAALKLTRQPPVLPPITVTPDNLSDYLGKRQYSSDRMYERTPVGVAMGLAWTSHGGSCIFIESTVSDRENNERKRGGSRKRERESGGVVESIDGGVEESETDSGNSRLPIASGPLHLFTTGQLGDVMRESSTIAYTVAKRLLATLDPGNTFFHSRQTPPARPVRLHAQGRAQRRHHYDQRTAVTRTPHRAQPRSGQAVIQYSKLHWRVEQPYTAIVRLS